MRIKKTKIVATIGPASSDYKVMLKLAKEGVNVFRFNFSHGDYKFFEKLFENIKLLRKTGYNVAALMDLQGPKIRVGSISEPLVLKRGETVAISGDAVKGMKTIPIDIRELYKYVKRGSKIQINDGMVELRVKEIKGKAAVCSVIEPGIVEKRKGVNIPGVILPISSMTGKDKKDLAFGIKNGVDIVCLSFVRHAKDIIDLKNEIKKHTDNTPVIIAKIEKPEAVKDIENILDVCDGIMAARGDLAVEAGFENVPVMQKKIINAANAKGKIVIVATQMLESMIENPYPTRSEMTDIYNAVIEGADALMLSGETSVGKYPVKAVNVMNRLALKAESLMMKKHAAPPLCKHECGVANFLAYCSALAPHFMKRTLIAVLNAETMQYSLISDYNPEYGILALCKNEADCRRAALLKGVNAVVKKGSVESMAVLMDRKIKNLVICDFEQNSVKTVNIR